MHPSRDVIGSAGTELAGKKIVLCVTGSVASVEAPELTRELMRRGAEVRAVMTPKARDLITPQLMHWATGNEVTTELTGKLEHVELASWSDLVLVAPATANTLSKIACAIDDTSVTSVVSVVMGLKKPVVVVPAMHASMYEHALLQENLSKLRSAGVHVIEPRFEEGKAKLAAREEIVGFVSGLLGPKDMLAMKVLVTAGPTIERVDPIKFITNLSSGKTGIAVARVASSRGAKTTLVYGPGREPVPAGVKVIRVESTRAMRDAVVEGLEEKPDIVVLTAAAQDFVVEHPFERKLPHSKPLSLSLVPAPRTIGEVRDRAPEAFVVGFKAEYGVSDEDLERVARDLLEGERLDMVVANDVSRPGAGFGSDTNEVLIVTPSSVRSMKGSKMEIAKRILDEAVKEHRKPK